MIPDLDRRRRYIKAKCLDEGFFNGNKRRIYCVNGKWFIEHKDQFGISSERYEDNLDDAVYDYVALENVYGIDQK